MTKTKTFLTALVMIGVLVGVCGIAVGAGSGTGNAIVDVTDQIDVTIGNIDYGAVAPNATSNNTNLVITVNENNNVNLNVAVSIDNSTAENLVPLFQNIYFKFGTEFAKLGEGTLSVDINDDSEPQSQSFPTYIAVPEGFAPGEHTGILYYLVTKRG